MQILLQIFILATGNYTFFNYLTITFLVLVLDDAFWLDYVLPKAVGKRLLSSRERGVFDAMRGWIVPLKTCLVFGLMCFLFLATLSPFFSRHIRHESLPQFVTDAHAYVRPYMVANNYGLFAGMTKTRDEIEIQGSSDLKNWSTYNFKFKPGDLYRAPPFVAPHQPRLDWQMWFAALSEAKQQPWFLRFVRKLLEGSVPVLNLLESNPFPEHPPKFIRAIRYRYKYTSFGTNSSDDSGGRKAWWTRQRVGVYLDPVNLNRFH